MIAIKIEPSPLRVDSDGVVRIGHTRVTLDTVVFAFEEGLSAEEIVQQYPSLDLGDVYAAISYYLKKRDEVESYLADRRRQAEEIQRQTEARFNPVGLRERLLARRRQSGS